MEILNTEMELSGTEMICNQPHQKLPFQHC